MRECEISLNLTFLLKFFNLLLRLEELTNN